VWPPSTQRNNFDKPSLGDILHHKPNLIHVRSEHNPRPVLRITIAGGKDTTSAIRREGMTIEFLAEHFPHEFLIS
jgi:hypothetical protein